MYIHDLSSAKTVMELLPFWIEDYNIHHPYKGLKMRSPREYRMVENKLEGCTVLRGQVHMKNKNLSKEFSSRLDIIHEQFAKKVWVKFSKLNKWGNACGLLTHSYSTDF